VFQNIALRKVLGYRRDWRKLYSEELRGLRGYVWGEGRDLHSLWWRNVNHRDNMEDADLDGERV
jgi:hypothetical protein